MPPVQFIFWYSVAFDQALQMVYIQVKVLRAWYPKMSNKRSTKLCANWQNDYVCKDQYLNEEFLQFHFATMASDENVQKHKLKLVSTEVEALVEKAKT